MLGKKKGKNIDKLTILVYRSFREWAAGKTFFKATFFLLTLMFMKRL